MEGEETGRKASAFDVCNKMRALRDDSGRKIFAKEEWLTTEKIAVCDKCRLQTCRLAGK